MQGKGNQEVVLFFTFITVGDNLICKVSLVIFGLKSLFIYISCLENLLAELSRSWGSLRVTQWDVNFPEKGQITAFMAYCIYGCVFCVWETSAMSLCVSFNVVYVTAAVSQLLSSFPESLIQRLPGYCRAVKVSYCVFVFADGWALIFIQAQEGAVK